MASYKELAKQYGPRLREACAIAEHSPDAYNVVGRVRHSARGAEDHGAVEPGEG